MSTKFFATYGCLFMKISNNLIHVTVWTSTLLCTFLAVLVAYRIWLHPLANVPGPKLSAVSNIWYAYHVKYGRTASWARHLHTVYGPAVRVGPNEVWFNSKEAYDLIYSTGSKGLEKSDFYYATSLNKAEFDLCLRPTFADNLDLLSERDSRRYRLQRRLIGPVYRASNVARYGPAVGEVLEKVIGQLKAFQGDQIDLQEWMHIIAVECLGASVLSWSPGLLRAKTDWGSSRHSYLGWRRKSVLGLFPIMAKLDMCSRTAGRLFGNIWGVTYQPPKGFRTFFPETARKASRRVNFALHPKDASATDKRQDLLTDLIQVHREKPEFSELYVKKMAVTNFGAGHETMAATLTSVMAMLGSHPSLQAQVRQELLDASITDPTFPSTHLPYTEAFVREAMRLYPVIAMGLPRQVPLSGATIDGYCIPSGTTVGCNPVALHRNEIICGSFPNEFRPERWLEDQERARTLDRYSLNWGGGSRACPGRNLAEMIVMKTVIALATHFDVEVDLPSEEHTPSYFLSMLTGVQARFLAVDPPL